MPPVKLIQLLRSSDEPRIFESAVIWGSQTLRENDRGYEEPPAIKKKHKCSVPSIQTPYLCIAIFCNNKANSIKPYALRRCRTSPSTT